MPRCTFTSEATLDICTAVCGSEHRLLIQRTFSRHLDFQKSTYLPRSITTGLLDIDRSSFIVRHHDPENSTQAEAEAVQPFVSHLPTRKGLTHTLHHPTMCCDVFEASMIPKITPGDSHVCFRFTHTGWRAPSSPTACTGERYSGNQPDQQFLVQIPVLAHYGRLLDERLHQSSHTRVR